ncbi:MAG: MFS transporter [Nitriliruptorales bacterium]|nr:MFS transporter [Nitriliruptorales bacterium]
MTELASTHLERRRTNRTLFVGAALGATGVAAALSIASLAGEATSGGTAWSGVPGATTVVGTAVGATLVSRWLDGPNRRRALTLGYVIAVVGAGICAFAIEAGVFLVLIGGTVLIGIGQATTHLTRYVVADLYTSEQRASAIGWIVWAGTVGGIIGPTVLAPTGAVASSVGLDELVGPYLATVIALGAIPLWYRLRLRVDPADQIVAETSAVHEPEVAAPDAGLLARPAVRVALAVMVTGQVVMILVMSMTPVHIRHGGGSLGIVGLVMSAHILGMYAFAPAVGTLVDRVGAKRVAVVGMTTLAGASILAAAANGHDVVLGGALWLLGVGWSLGFVSGSAMLARSLPLAVRTRVQGQVETVVWLSSAGASLGAGLLLAGIGFAGLCWLGAAFTALPTATLLRSMLRPETRPA